MLRTRLSLCLAAALLSPMAAAPSARAEVPKEIKSKYSRVKGLVDQCDKLSKGPTSPRELENIADRLDKAKDLSKDFPAEVPEIVDLRQKISACEAEIQKLRGAQEGAAAKAADDNAALEAGAKKDLENVLGASAALGDVIRGAGSIATHMRTQVIDDLKRWPQAKAGPSVSSTPMVA